MFYVAYHREKQRGLLCNVHGQGPCGVVVGYCGDETLVRGSWLKELFKSSRVDRKAFLAQRCSNSRGRFLVLAKYRGGS